MKTKTLSRLRIAAIASLCIGGLTLFSSFDGSGSSGSGEMFRDLGPQVDCSSMTPQYNSTSTSGSGSGAASGSYGGTGVSGSVSGSGSGSTTNTGLVGYIRTPKAYRRCDGAYAFTCSEIACTQNGAQTFVPIH
jgi:hypothetical protein